MGKNNKYVKSIKEGTKVESYSIKKFKAGAASVVIGASIFLGAGAVAQASEDVSNNTTADNATNSGEKVEATSQPVAQPKVENTKESVASAVAAKVGVEEPRAEAPKTEVKQETPAEAKLDKIRLEAYISEISANIGAGKYANKTDESVAVLKAELENAKATLENAKTQVELNAAYNKLVTTVNSKLVNKPVEKKETPAVDTTNGKETVGKKAENTEKKSDSNSIENTGSNDSRNGKALDKNNAFRAETTETSGNFTYSMEYSNGKKDIYLYNEEEADVNITVSSTAGNITKATVKGGSGQFVLSSKSKQAIAYAKKQSSYNPPEEEVEIDDFGWSYHQTLTETQGPVTIKITGKPNDTFKELTSYTKTENQEAVLGSRFLQLKDSTDAELRGGRGASDPGYFRLVVKSQTYKYDIQPVAEENKVAVADINNLTTDDINKIKEKIKIQYSDKATTEDARLASKKGEVLADRSTVVKEVAVANGTVTVTYNDDSVDTTPVASVARTNPAPTVELPYSNADKRQIYVYTGENTDLTFTGKDDKTVKDLYLRGPGGVGTDNTAGYGFTTGKIDNGSVTNGEGAVSADKTTATIKMTGVTTLKAPNQWTSFIVANDNDNAKSMPSNQTYDASTDDAVRQQKPGYVQFIVKNQTSKYEISAPTEKVAVADPANITDAELEKIKEKLKLEYNKDNDDANLADKKGKNVDDKDAKIKSVTKDANGNLVVTYADGSQDTRALSDFVTIDKQPALDAVNKAAEDKIAEINKTPNATNEEKAAAIAKVNADKEKAVAAINDTNLTTKAALDKAKEAGATSIAADNPVVTKKDSAKADVEAARKAKADAINADKNLSQAEKDAAIAKINKVAEDATKAIDAATTDAAVDTAKNTGTTEFGKVNPIAKENAKEAIANALTAKNKEIDDRTDLTQEEKDAAKAEAKKLADAELAKVEAQPDNVETADAAAAAQKIVNNAEDKGVADVTSVYPIAKEQAKQAVADELTKKEAEIDARTDLTQEEKDAAKKEEQAKAKAATDAINAQPAIANSEDKATAAQQAVDTAKNTGVSEVKAVNPEAKAKPAAKKAIDEEAKAKKAAIDARNDLSTKAKEALKAKVDKVAKKAKEAIDAVSSVVDVNTIEEADKEAIRSIGGINRPIDKVLVKDPSALTDEEKAKILEEVKKVNPTAKEVKYNKDGKIEVTTENGDKGTINPAKLVKTENDLDNGKGGNDINKPLDKVIVKDPANLTDEEKAKIVAKVEEVNPDAIVTIDENGTVSVSTPDGKTSAIPASDLVRTKEDTEKAGAGNSNIVKPADKVVGEANDPDDQAKAEEKLRELNPETKSVKFDQNGNATVTLKDGTTATIPSEDLFRAETDATKPNAGNDIVKPADKTVVANKDALTPEEKKAIEDKVKAVNPGATVVVDDKGNSTVTTKDGKTAVIPSTDLVKSAEDATKPNAGNDIVKPADKTVVANKDTLTPEEKKAIEDKVKAVNPGATVAVDDKGNATVTTPEGKPAVIPATDLVKSAEDATKPNAGNDVVKPADKTLVKDPAKLTDEEKTAIVAKVQEVNPGATVVVDDKGNATVTTPEGKTAVIPATDLVKSAEDATKPNAGNDVVKPADKTLVKDPAKLTDEEKAAIAAKVKEVNPEATVVIDDKGNATVTTKEGKTAVIPATDLVKSGADLGKENAGNDINTPTARTAVANKDALTDAEKGAVKKAVEAVNPGATVVVDDKGNATVTTKDGKVAVIPASKLVIPADKVTDVAAQSEIKTPAARTLVANKDSLTLEEIAKIKAAVEAVNPGAIVVVDAKGNATVTTKDGVTATISAEQLVKDEKDVAAKNNGENINLDFEKQVVVDLDNLTDADKAGAKDKILAANPNVAEVIFDAKGNVTVILKDGSSYTILAKDIFKKAEEQATSVNVSPEINFPERVQVGNPMNLTDEEKETVKQALIKANPELKEAKITISATGETTIVYPDGRVVVIPAEKLVMAKGSNNNGGNKEDNSTNVSRENNGASDNAPKANSKLGQRLANTGTTETNTGLAGLGLAILGGLLAAARRKNDKN